MIMAATTTVRAINTIAAEIDATWAKVWFGARPYLDAMYSLGSIREDYGADSGVSVVRYFLANAATWRGEDARRIKKELKSMTGDK